VATECRTRSTRAARPTSRPAGVADAQRRGRSTAEQLGGRVEALRERSTLFDLGFRVYDRDRDAAGTLLGSALALRLFLFFLPLLLFGVGVAGIIGRWIGYDSLSSDVGIAGSVGRQIDSAFEQGSGGAWLLCVAGIVGMVSTGYSLSRALVLSSAMSWNLGGRQRTEVRVIASLAGVIVGIALVSAIVNRIRAASGVAVASVSFIAVLGVYVLLWLVVFQLLPRATTDPGASLPGAAVTALTLTGMQAISVLYLPGAIERSSDLYGAIGISVATLGWIYIIGRVLAFCFSLNAVVFERLGSASGAVFALPVLRALPVRYPRLATFFDLAHARETDADTSSDTSSDTSGDTSGDTIEPIPPSTE
jgi:uncharacterized BrkB/YihY/UPF0761 family membrane protein